MSPVTAIRYPDGSIRVEAAYHDSEHRVYGCGGEVEITPDDPDYQRYAAEAISWSEYRERFHDNPAESAAIVDDFLRRYHREHGRRSA